MVAGSHGVGQRFRTLGVRKQSSRLRTGTERRAERGLAPMIGEHSSRCGVRGQTAFAVGQRFRCTKPRRPYSWSMQRHRWSARWRRYSGHTYCIPQCSGFPCTCQSGLYIVTTLRVIGANRRRLLLDVVRNRHLGGFHRYPFVRREVVLIIEKAHRQTIAPFLERPAHQPAHRPIPI